MNCPACGSVRSRSAFGDRATFLRCEECRSLFETNPLSGNELKAIYEGKGYFVKDEDADEADSAWGYSEDYLAEQGFIEAKFERVLGHLERYVDPGRLLDVGCGPGFLLNVARRRGWDVVGIDLNPWATDYARQELGLDVHTGLLDAAAFAGEQFDAVTMMDMVEHVSDPDSLLAEVSRLVRPGGGTALLTPDAGSPISRLLGHRWPEVQKPGEHTVLFSVQGLAAMLSRHSFAASGFHSVGKTARVGTLVADVSSAAPGLSARVRDAMSSTALADRVVEFDPRTKFCLYARKLPEGARAPVHQPARVPRRPEGMADVSDAIAEELESLDAAPRKSAWVFDTFAELVPGADVLEVGAGIGTFTRLMLGAGAKQVMAIEPEAACADVLERDLADEPKLRVRREALPDAPSLAGETFDLVVCDNVLEHIGDEAGALSVMVAALRPGGHLVLVVPAGPRLFGALDDAYGHWRRYGEADVRQVVGAAGLRIESLQAINALGIPGWWAKNRRPGARVGPLAIRINDVMLAMWRPIEERLKPPFGLSLVCIAVKPV